MPKTVDYARTAIYKIVCRDLAVSDVYVGSTTDIVQRQSGHKSNCTNQFAKNYNQKVYQCIRKTGGWSNWDLVLVEKFPCTSSEEQRMRERHWIEVLNATLNAIAPIKTEVKMKHTRKFVATDHIKETYKHGAINFSLWFAMTFNVGRDLKVSKQDIDKLTTMDALEFRINLKNVYVEFAYESQERMMVDGVKFKGFYHGFGLK